MYKLDGKGKEVLIISDTHIPYSHPYYIKFLASIKEKYKPDIVIHIGDELDYHAISFHDSDSSLFSADMELDRSIIELQEGLHNLFPKMYVLESNHGSLVYRRLKAGQIPIRVLKPLPELYETPNWSWHFEILLETNMGPTYLCHGRSGAYGKLALSMGTNAIQGHYHGKAEVTWHKTALREYYNMFVGCLVDKDSMAMAYGRINLPDPVIACGRIDKDGMPHIIKMRVEDYE